MTTTTTTQRPLLLLLQALLLAGMLLATAVEAHVCILSPTQRGGYNVTTAGDPSCYRRTPYCGGVPAPGSAPAAVYVAGQPATITFEQNLNHWFAAKPGFFDVALSYNSASPSDADFTVLATLPDFAANDMVTRTVLNVPVVFPAEACAHCILRLRYVSHNPMEIDPPNNTDVVFYNCADIALVAPAAIDDGERETEEAAIKEPTAGVARADSGYACTTPPSWMATMIETNAWGSVAHAVFWDAASQLTRWDQNGSLDASGDSAFILINDYSKPLEYVFNVATGACPIYGNDAFYPWAYGANNSMVYTGSVNGLDTWAAAGDSTRQLTWVTKPLGNGLCQPVAWTRGAATVTVLEFFAGPVAPSVFNPPAVCTKKPVFAGCHAAATAALFHH